MLRKTWLLMLIPLALVVPYALAGHGGTTSPTPQHDYGNGHADVAWTFSPNPQATGHGHLTTNLATFGQALAFGMPMPVLELSVGPASSVAPVTGRLVMDVPAASDPWWGTYMGGVPPGITSGGTVELTLAGYAEHHPNAVTLYGTYTITAATGQYAGLSGVGDFSGSTTGGGGSFGPFFDFAVMGSYV